LLAGGHLSRAKLAEKWHGTRQQQITWCERPRKNFSVHVVWPGGKAKGQLRQEKQQQHKGEGAAAKEAEGEMPISSSCVCRDVNLLLL